MIGERSSATSYAYDAIGKRTKLGSLNYTYDLAGRPLSVSMRDCTSCAPVPLVTSASYLPFGPESDVLFGNGTRQTKSYDSRYRITENKLTGPSAQFIARYGYTSDAAGNITAMHDLMDATFNRDFGYDDLSRLTSASTGTSLWGTGGFTYDAMGNLVSSSVGAWNQSFTFIGTTPRIAQATENGSSSPVDYDAAGNELDSNYVVRPGTLVAYRSANVSRFYSCRNLMAVMSVSWVVPCGETLAHCNPRYLMFEYDYMYDGRGVRVKAVNVSYGEIDYTYTPELRLSEIYDASAASAQRFVWFNGYPVAQVSSTTPLFTFTDHLGTPLLQTDSAAAVAWRAEYEPYGRIYALRNGTAPEDQPLRLPGQDLSAHGVGAIEENYNIFRWYRSGWGRYTQPDPLGLATEHTAIFYSDWTASTNGENLYGYAAARPTILTDRTGLQVAIPIPSVGPAAGAIGGATAVAALAACWQDAACRRWLKCTAALTKDISRCTYRGFCNATSNDPLHNLRVESCILRSWANYRACRQGWPRPFPDPWPGPGFRGPGGDPGSPDEPPPTYAEPPAVVNWQ